jgi:hypothetical protein
LKAREEAPARLRAGAQSQFNSRARKQPIRIVRTHDFDQEAHTMSKGLNQKKDAKKKPTKTLKERRAEKQAKRQGK